jgi:hypothetical protein
MIELFLSVSCSEVHPWLSCFCLYHALRYIHDWVVFGSIMLWGTSMIELFLALSCSEVPLWLSCFCLYHALRYIHDWVVFGSIMLWGTSMIELFLAPSCYLQCISKLRFWLPYRNCITKVKTYGEFDICVKPCTSRMELLVAPMRTLYDFSLSAVLNDLMTSRL